MKDGSQKNVQKLHRSRPAAAKQTQGFNGESADLNDLAVHICVEHARHEPCADALDLVRACEHGSQRCNDDRRKRLTEVFLTVETRQHMTDSRVPVRVVSCD